MATRLMLVAVMLAGLAGCGQSGPLYSPHPSQAHQQQQANTQAATEAAQQN